MSFLVPLGLRNLRRNLRRTALSMVSVIAGVFVLILGQGFIGGLDENLIRASVDATSAHVLARPAGYPEHGLAHPVDELFELDGELGDWLESASRAWTTRLLFVPTAVAHGDSLRLRGFGFDPERDPAVFPRTAWKTTGEDPGDDEVLLGAGAASLLGVTAGEEIVLQVRTASGAVNALRVRVAGVFAASNVALDKIGVFVPMPLAERLLDVKGERSHVFMRLPDRAEVHTRAAAAGLRDRVGEGLEVSTWIDETAEMLALQTIRRRALGLLVLALMGMSATGIANTVLMAAYERVREIGTLQAMGMQRDTVLKLFLVEGAVIGAVGGGIGATLGAAVVGYFSRVGIDLSAPAEAGLGGSIPMSTMLYLEFSLGWVAVAFLFGLCVAVLASVYPARVASAMVPADAVRAA